MTLGEKIAEARKQMKLSQEQLAERLSVSRSAVAKWETAKGMPDIENFIGLSKVLGVSIDYLVGNKVYTEDTDDNGEGVQKESDSSEKALDDILKRYEQRLGQYIGKNCNIELSGWNDGVRATDIISWDKDFIYYLRKDKKNNIIGAIAIRLIEEIKITNKRPVDISAYKGMGREFFIGRRADVNFEEKNILSGIFGDDTELLGCMINSFSKDELIVVLDGAIADYTIPIEKISKLEIGS